MVIRPFPINTEKIVTDRNKSKGLGGRDLKYPPADDRIRNRNFINVASLYFGKEGPKIQPPVTC